MNTDKPRTHVETFEVSGHEITVYRTFVNGIGTVSGADVGDREFDTVDEAIAYVDEIVSM